MEIISKPSDQAVAYKIKFIDGAPTAEGTKPAARRNGTTIRATNLYHNMGTRKGTMSVGDERNKISDVVKAYATHYHKTSVTWFRIVENQNAIKSTIDVFSILE